MFGRTFFRIWIERLFINNPIGKAIAALVNFCNNSTLYDKKKLKFLKKMPLDKEETLLSYDRRFIFENSYNYGANTK